MTQTDAPKTDETAYPVVPPAARPASPDSPAIIRPLLSVHQVADALGVGERYVRRIVAEHRMPYFKIGGKVRFAREDLDAFIAAARCDVRLTVAPEDDWEDFLGRDPLVEFLECQRA